MRHSIDCAAITTVLIQLAMSAAFAQVETRPGQQRSPSVADSTPELPRERVETTYDPPSGRVWKVRAAADLQAVLDRVRPGETIELPAGETFRGNFKLRKKDGDRWIYIRTSAYSKLPPPGTRVSPEQHSQLMPKIVGVGSSPGRVFEAEFAAHHYRFVGIEITTEHDHRKATVSNLFVMGVVGATHATSRDQLTHHIIFDRCYLHGTPTGNVRRGILLNGNHLAVIDSHLSDFHEVGQDSQALMGTNGEGPFLIANNYLEGSGENMMFGGVDPRIDNLNPSDIEIVGNHFAKPWSWKIGHPEYAGIPWTVKNILEFKNARRVLVDGNLFENCWAQAQQGSAILLSVRNQGGSAPWTVVQDVTFTRNLVQHTASGFRVTGSDSNQPSRQTSRVVVRNNLFADVDRAAYGGFGTLFQVVTRDRNKPIAQLTIENNTAIHGRSGNGFFSIEGDAPAVQGLTFRNNIATHGQYGFKGSGKGIGVRTMQHYLRGYSLTGNVLVGGGSNQPAAYPRGNSHVPSLQNVGFVDATSEDYRLSQTSRFQGRGANVAEVMEAAEKASEGVRELAGQ